LHLGRDLFPNLPLFGERRSYSSTGAGSTASGSSSESTTGASAETRSSPRSRITITPWVWRPISEMEPVAVRSHRDQIALSIFGRLHNSLGRIAQREKRIHGQSSLPQCFSRTFQISAIVFHLLRLGQVELVIIAGDVTVGDVDEQ